MQRHVDEELVARRVTGRVAVLGCERRRDKPVAERAHTVKIEYMMDGATKVAEKIDVASTHTAPAKTTHKK